MLPPTLTSQSICLFDAEKARFHFQCALEELAMKPNQLEKLVLYHKEKPIAQALQRQWKKVLGVEIQLAQLDPKSHASRLQNKDYQIGLALWIAQFDDPISILDRFKDKNQLKNYPGWEDGKYARLLSEANRSDQRKQVLLEAEQIFAEHLPLTPIYHWRSPALCGPRIQAMGTTPSGGVLFERFRLSSP
jgi:oligopeptide transport system substrate-binding protein